MNKNFVELFEEATFDESRIVNGMYHPYIPLQIYGEPIRYSVTKAQYEKFARLMIQECIKTLEEAADDIDNGDIFRDQELLNKFEERWSAGLHYAIEKIEERFSK
jgi:flagellin-specific chaperone FliS